MLIDVTMPKEFPKEIGDMVFSFFSELSDYRVSELTKKQVENSTDVRRVIEPIVNLFSGSILLKKLVPVFKKHKLRCFHATNVLNEEDIISNGLYTNSLERYIELILNAIKSVGYSEQQIELVTQKIIDTHNNRYNGQDGLLCFYTNPSEEFYREYCKNIGGELATIAFVAMPDVLSTLKRIGKPIVVEFELPFENIKDLEGDILQFVVYYAGVYFWNKEYEIDYDSNTNMDITPDQIIDIHHV